MTNVSSDIKHHASLLANVKATLDYCFEELKDTKINIAEVLVKIAQIEFQIKKTNLDIELTEDPYGRPLETGQESPRVEKLIRTMESEVKYLEGDLFKLKGQLAIYNNDISLHEDQISTKLSRLEEIKDDLKKILSPDKEFEKTFGQIFKEAASIKAEYRSSDD